MTSPEESTSDDLLEAMAEADCLEVYLRLPETDRVKFSYWVEEAPDDESHWRRIEALVVAMRISPLQPATLQPQTERVSGPTAD